MTISGYEHDIFDSSVLACGDDLGYLELLKKPKEILLGWKER